MLGWIKLRSLDVIPVLNVCLSFVMYFPLYPGVQWFNSTYGWYIIQWFNSTYGWYIS